MVAPEVHPSAGMDRAPAPGPRFEATVPSSRNSLTILVVDDEPWARMITARILRDSGYTVLEAGSGTEALDLLHSSGHLSLVITDLAMPGMDGVQLARTIRNEDPQQSVAFISGFGALMEKLGATGPRLPMMQKPLTADQLITQVREILERPIT